MASNPTEIVEIYPVVSPLSAPPNFAFLFNATVPNPGRQPLGYDTSGKLVSGELTKELWEFYANLPAGDPGVENIDIASDDSDGREPSASNDSAVPPRLAPSVEDAYRKKAIEMRRRTLEIEEQNDIQRLKNARLRRGIEKMRLERAILLSHLKATQNKSGESILPTLDDGSENSSDDEAPTPQERPLRTKRSHRRAADASSPTDPHQAGLPLTATAAAQISSMTGMTTPMTGTSAGLHTGIPMTTPGLAHQPEVMYAAFDPESNLLPPALPHYDPMNPDTFPPGPPEAAHELFKVHMARELIPNYPDHFGIIPTPEARTVRAQQFWDNELGDGHKNAWIDVHDDLERRWNNSHGRQDWGRVTGNTIRRMESGIDAAVNAEMGGDSEKGDGDTVMMGVEEDEEGR